MEKNDKDDNDKKDNDKDVFVPPIWRSNLLHLVHFHILPAFLRLSRFDVACQHNDSILISRNRQPKLFLVLEEESGHGGACIILTLQHQCFSRLAAMVRLGPPMIQIQNSFKESLLSPSRKHLAGPFCIHILEELRGS